MDRFHRYGNLLKPDGTNQLQRTLPALEQGYVLPDERSLSDLVGYARQLAAEIRFYSLTGQPTGDWRPFLEPLVDPATGRARSTAELEAALVERRDWPPHVALFLVFLKLFRHLQKDLNELPSRHLRHYYEEELRLLRREAAAADVHVIFELAKNAAETLLPAGTVLDAGKDGEGRPLGYATRNEVVISAARISEVRRLVAETDRLGRRRFFVSELISEDEGASWYTFGRRQLPLDAGQRFMTEAEMGFAFASPLLRMAEGERTLTITAQLRAADGVFPRPQRIDFGLRAELTGDEGWVSPETFEARLVDNGPEAMTLEIDLALSAAAPAIVPFDAALHGDGPVSEHPVLRCLLRGQAGHYQTLDGLIVERATLTVTVDGVRDLVVQNDQGPLSPDQPMELFGSRPRNGARFYVGSAEVFGKKLSALTLHLEWQDPPADLFARYQAYFDNVDESLEVGFSNDFLTEVELLYDRSWEHKLPSKHTLFGFPDPARKSISANPVAIFGDRPYGARPELLELGQYAAGTRYGFLRLLLDGPSYGAPQAAKVPFEAFGHQAFPPRAAIQAIALSQWNGTDPEPKLANEPYTPTLASLSIDYTSSVEMLPGDPYAAETLFVLGPWGHTPAGGEVAARLVPELDREAARDEDEVFFQGALFLGVEGLEPPANLSLLFQIDSGTAAAAEVLESGETQWSYLSGATWETLPREAVLNDGTFGFQQPGLVVLSIGREATTEHTAMPGGLVWLRALIRRPPESASRTLSLAAQAALATFAPETGALEDYDEHLQEGLAAETIQRLSKRQAAIKTVSQPDASFGGRGPEQDADFFRRRSERLRHRRRAVTVWDFERLVLEAFPEVFKVKCLPHSDADGDDKAGEAALVILPDLRSTPSTNPLEPRAGAVLMGRIEDYVAAGLATPFLNVHVIHPVYERLLVDARVAFQAGLDAGYYANLLDEHLRRFLSPWAFEEGRDIVFDARIYRSEILAFLEGQDYVDYVVDFSLYHSFDGPPRGGIGEMVIGTDFVIRSAPRLKIPEMTIGDDFVVGRGVEVAEATRPHAILVSAAAHRITPLAPGEDVCTGVRQLGIGYMTIGLDFVVHPE